MSVLIPVGNFCHRDVNQNGLLDLSQAWQEVMLCVLVMHFGHQNPIQTLCQKRREVLGFISSKYQKHKM